MEKKIITFFTILIVLVALPYCIYTVYINHQDDLYKTLTEFDSYTTINKDYDIKVMKYQGVSGEEVYNFKVYVVRKSDGEVKFIRNVKVSAYGTEFKCTEDKKHTSYDVDVIISSSSNSDKDAFTVDLENMIVKGQRVRAVF